MNEIMLDGIYPNSLVEQDGTVYAMLKGEDDFKYLAVRGDLDGFDGVLDLETDVLICPLTAANAATLRNRLPWLNPVPLGITTSFGFGDRIGLATPGHVAAVMGTGMAPIFAQQSVRENTRIGRTPQQVLDDALWGVFEMGWRDPWGADADHVKVVEDLPPFVAAGYTFYTIDPSDHVDNDAQTDNIETLRAKVAALPWDRLESSYAAAVETYCASPIELDGLTLVFDEETLLRALAKYGNAVAHALTIADALTAQMDGKPFDLEMSIDETDTPTSVHEHYYIANELIRHGLPVVSVAPRFVGKFQKGVDYIGDVDVFAQDLTGQVAILRHFNCYKLSIHTGSDKFSIYPAIAEQAGSLVHVKTAGTSYLEALRVIAVEDPVFFRTILDFSRSKFEYDRKSYFLDCQLDKVPAAAEMSDEQLPGLLDDFDARQVLHVTFGSVLDNYGDELKAFIRSHEAEYLAGLDRHFARHVQPFVQA